MNDARVHGGEGSSDWSATSRVSCWDAVVVGAGPAGAMAARPLQALRLGGWSNQAHLPLHGTVAISRSLSPLAARADASWDPDLLTEWERVHGGSIGRSQRICRFAAWTLSRPLLSKSLLWALKDRPKLADPVARRVGLPLLS